MYCTYMGKCRSGSMRMQLSGNREWRAKLACLLTISSECKAPGGTGIQSHKHYTFYKYVFVCIKALLQRMNIYRSNGCHSVLQKPSLSKSRVRGCVAGQAVTELNGSSWG